MPLAASRPKCLAGGSPLERPVRPQRGTLSHCRRALRGRATWLPSLRCAAKTVQAPKLQPCVAMAKCVLASVAMDPGVTEQAWTCNCLFFGASATEPNRDSNGSQRTSLLYMGGKGDSTKPSPDCVGLGFWPLRCKEPFI